MGRSRGARALFGVVAAAGLLVYGGYLRRHTCFAVGGSDSSGYANAARALVRGPLVASLASLERFGLPDAAAPAFTPLGFAHVPGTRSVAPLYPVGFPLHEAAAALALGWETGPFLVSPLAALVSLVLLFLVGRELGLPRWGALGAAALMAACPVFVFQAVQPMSDVVATLWCLAAVFAALRSRARPRWATAAGFAFGVAVLVRPMDALLAVPLFFALPRDRRALMRFALGGLPCAALLFVYDTVCFGGPFTTGYGITGHARHFRMANFAVHFPRYVRWVSDQLTPIVCLGWLAAAASRRITGRDRALLFAWFGVFLVAYSFYDPADAWWYTRFLLPGLPAVVLAFSLVVRDLCAAVPARPRPWAVAAAVAVIAASSATGFRNTRRWGALDVWKAESIFPEACRLAAGRLPSGALVLSRDFSGALRYYTGLTPVRWDGVEPGTLAGLKALTEDAGAPWFALLKSYELSDAVRRVPGQWTRLGEVRDATLWRLEPAPDP